MTMNINIIIMIQNILYQLFPKIAKNSGLEFADLIEWMVNDAGVNR